MKKIIIALLVVLSVFALVSCSSSEPTVTAQTLTLNTKDGSVDSWTTQYAYNKTGYGVWYKNAAGKYVAVDDTVLTDVDGKIIGTLDAEFEDLAQTTYTTIDGKQNIVTTFLGTEFTLSVTGNDTNAGVWTGEVAVAAKAVSDTQLSGVVGRYNVTFTNTVTVTPATYYNLGNIALAHGGDYAAADGTKTVYYGTTAVDLTKCAIFEQLAGGYKFIEEFEGGEVDKIKLGTDGVGTFDVEVATGHVGNDGFKFTLNDSRGDANSDPNSGKYEQFIDYKYAAKTYVIAKYTYNLEDEAVIDSDPIVSFALSADMPALKTFSTAKTISLTGIKVAEEDEHVNLFVLKGGEYELLSDYYIGESDTGLSVGCAEVSEAMSGSLTRTLTVKFEREDAPGEKDPALKATNTISETVDVKIVSYSDILDEKTYTEIATLKMYFANDDAVKFDLTTILGDTAEYWLGTGEVKDWCYVYCKISGDSSDLGYKWRSFTFDAQTGVSSIGNVVIGSNICTLSIEEGQWVESALKSVKFKLTTTSGTRTSYDDLYVKFTGSDGSDQPAKTKLCFDCISYAAAPTL